MRVLRKGQAAAFRLTRNIRGEVRIVERAFGIGACALTEAVVVFSERLKLQTARTPWWQPTERPPSKAEFATEPSEAGSSSS